MPGPGRRHELSSDAGLRCCQILASANGRLNLHVHLCCERHFGRLQFGRRCDRSLFGSRDGSRSCCGLLRKVSDYFVAQRIEGGDAHLEQFTQQSPRLALGDLRLLMVPLGSVRPSAHRRAQPSGKGSRIKRCSDSPFVLRQAAVAVHADRPTNRLNEGAWAGRDIGEDNTPHGKEAHTLAALCAVCNEYPIQLAAQIRRRIEGSQLVHSRDTKTGRAIRRRGQSAQMGDQCIHAGMPRHQNERFGRVRNDVIGDGVEFRRTGIDVVQDARFAPILPIMHGTEVDAQVAIALQAPLRQAHRSFFVIPLQRLARQRHLFDELPPQLRGEHRVRNAFWQRPGEECRRPHGKG
mmetsp:Transcript_118857/g.341302  ORF Transcript_118857/g.341302 Transcript_118857/m.341302 type:complete len:350 (-) Transcript_118857:1930-2979(-)